MKKKLLTILITSLMMIGLMGGFLWKMNSISHKIAKGKKELLQQELDLDKDKKAWKDVDELDITPLKMSGVGKNVITRDYQNLTEVYNTTNSAMAEELLTDIKKKGEYTAENPLWAYNPYGTNAQSMYVYFKSDGKYYCRYTISVKDKKIPDFTRTLCNGASGNVTQEHEYQLMGLVPGQTNYIIMKLYNSKDELSRTMVYTIEMPANETGARLLLDSETGRSKVSISNGLYTVFQSAFSKKETKTRTVVKKTKKNGKNVKKKVTVTQKHSAILLYDNSGVLRGEIPTISDAAENAEIIYDNLVYFYDDNKIARINSLGQVVGSISMPGYSLEHEFAYDGYGSIYFIGNTRGRANQPASTVLKVELESEEVTEALHMEDVLKAVYEKQAKKKSSGKLDWIGLDSIQVVGTNQLLLGSSRLSSIFKVSNTGSLVPKLDYIISDKKLWKDYKKLKKKVLEKALPEGATEPPEETPLVDSILDTGIKETELFTSQYGQNALVVQRDSALAEGQYYVYLLNNNDGAGAAKSNQNSYYYQYLVDETAGTYILAEKARLEKNHSGGNVTPWEESFLYCVSDKDTFLECDTGGKLIKSFRIKEDLYRVYKDEWKGFWFY